MKIYIQLLLLISLFSSSLYASEIGDKYDKYIEKLQKERDNITKSRSVKSELRRWNHDIDKLTNRRDIAEEAREIKSSVRKELRKIF